jgi:preprotein translocase subunit SecE
MSRAVRRQQQQAATKKETPKRSLGMRTPAPTRGARPAAAAPRRRLRFGTPGWMSDIISELKKVTWPTRDETIYLTTVVIIVSVAVGIFLGGVDLFFSWLIDKLLLS